MMVTMGSFLAYDATGPLAAFFLFLIALINMMLRRTAPRHALTSDELIVVYGMMLVANIAATWGLSMRFLPITTGVMYFATETNEWVTRIHPHLNRFLFMQDADALKKFFEGLPAGERIPWRSWVPFLSVWIAFYAVFFLFIVLILVYFRKQWSERERLSYPLAQLPMAMVQQDETSHPFFSDRLMWLGFAIPMAFGTLIYLSNIFPTIPRILLERDIPVFRDTTSILLRFSFAVFGVTYFMGQDLAFSLWFFYLLLTLEQGIFNITGISLVQPVPFSEGRDLVVFQSAGAIIAFVAIAVWETRHTIASFFRRQTEGRSEGTDLSRGMFNLLCACAVIILVFFRLLGMQFSVALLYFLLVAVILIAMAKIQAHGGSVVSRDPVRPATALIALTGSRMMKPGSIIGVSMHLLPFNEVVSTNALKLAEKQECRRILPFALTLGFVFGLVGALWMILVLGYRHGAMNAHNWLFQSQPTGIWRFVTETIKHPTPPNTQAIAFMAAGGIFYTLLSVMRFRVLWWPLHPIGFAFAINYHFTTIWFSVFLGWLVKTLVLRYAGVPTFKRLKGFFLGLVLGHFSTNCLFVIVDMLTGQRGRMVFWA